jgi:hypothetical protein
VPPPVCSLLPSSQDPPPCIEELQEGHDSVEVQIWDELMEEQVGEAGCLVTAALVPRELRIERMQRLGEPSEEEIFLDDGIGVGQ